MLLFINPLFLISFYCQKPVEQHATSRTEVIGWDRLEMPSVNILLMTKLLSLDPLSWDMDCLLNLWPLLIPCSLGNVPGASVRNSAHGKGHEEGGLAYAKAWSSLRKSPVPEHLTPKPESVLCSHLHLWLYGGLSPITVSFGEGVNVQLQGNKNSWVWQECFSLRTPLKVI